MSSSTIDASGVRVVSVVPGRVRLQADRSRRPALGAVAEELARWPSIAAVELRMPSASIVVRFEPDHLKAVTDALSELGVEPPTGGEQAGPSSPAGVIAGAANAGNRAVGQRLQGTDLRTLVPLGLGLLAARRAARGGERLADAPWYVLAWYASETFLKFHGGVARRHDRVAEGEED